MLQRFRTLFNLPSIIRNSISKGEYDLAVREYKKAKSIALPSHVCLYTLSHSLETDVIHFLSSESFLIIITIFSYSHNKALDNIEKQAAFR